MTCKYSDHCDHYDEHAEVCNGNCGGYYSLGIYGSRRVPGCYTENEAKGTESREPSLLEIILSPFIG